MVTGRLAAQIAPVWVLDLVLVGVFVFRERNVSEPVRSLADALTL